MALSPILAGLVAVQNQECGIEHTQPELFDLNKEGAEIDL